MLGVYFWCIEAPVGEKGSLSVANDRTSVSLVESK